jgi:mRNA interferase RelE/StbE
MRRCGLTSTVRIEWHEASVEDLRRLDGAARRRIRDVLQGELPKHPDLRRKLEPYKGPLKGYWKLRVGDWRLVCALEGTADEPTLFVVLIAHRSTAYERQGLRRVRARIGR